MLEHGRHQALRGAGVVLDGRQRVAAVGPDLRLLGIDALDQLLPTAGRAGGRERQGVEVHAQHPFGVRGFESAVVDDAGVEGVVGGQRAHRLEVGGEQHALQGSLRPDRELAQPRLQVPVDHGMVVLDCRLAARRPGVRQLQRCPVGGDPLPERLVLLARQRGQLGGDVVGVAHRRSLVLGQFTSVAQRLVDGGELHHQAVQGPALGDGVAVADGQPPGAVLLQVGVNPHQRRADQLEACRQLGLHEDLPRALPVLGAEGAPVVQRDPDPGGGVHQLERLGVAAEVHRGAQRLMALRHGVDGCLERGQREPLLVRDPEGVDVVVDVPAGLVGRQHLDQHAGLDLRERVGVDQAVRQQRAVLGADHGEGLDCGDQGFGGDLAVQQLGECGDGAVLEDVPYGGVVAGGAQGADQADGADGVAAEVEEVVLDADPVDAEDVGPDGGQPPFEARARRGMLSGREGVVVGCGQGAGVELAVDGQGDAVDGDVGGGDHVVGQGGAQVGAQGCGVEGFVGDEVGHELLGGGGDDGFAYGGVVAEGGFDFAEFDAVAADFDLLVDAAEEVEGAVGEVAGLVAAAVEAGAGRAVGVGEESFGGEVGAVEVAAGDGGSGDVDLAGHPDGHQLSCCVEEMDGRVGERDSDGVAVGAVEVGRLDLVVGGVDGGFGDAVHVDQGRLFEAVAVGPGAQFGEFEAFAGEDDGAQGELVGARVAIACERGEGAERGGRLAEDGGAGGDEEVEELVGGAGDGGGDDDESAAVQQCAPHFPDGDVEGVGVEERPDV